MPAEQSVHDDPVIRRVAAVRPPVPEEDLSPHSARAQAIAERVLAGPAAVGPRRRRRRWAWPRWALPQVGLALTPVAVAAAVVVLLLAGTFSGPDDSGTQAAAAAVIRTAVRTLSSWRNVIFVEDQTYVSGPMVHGHPYTFHQVLETPAHGPQDYLSSTDNAVFFSGRAGTASGSAVVGGTQSVYAPKTNTIYQSSVYGPYLHPGPRPGLFTYRVSAGAPVFATHPVIVTAAQRQALLGGRAVLRPTTRLVHGKVDIGKLKVQPPEQSPAQYQESLRQEIVDSHLHLVGRTTIDGRRAIELAAKTTDGTAPGIRMYFDPTTRLPIEEITNVGTRRQTVIRLQVQSLPITPANERLLDLHRLHPTARIDRSQRDYLRNVHITVFSQ